MRSAAIQLPTAESAPIPDAFVSRSSRNRRSSAQVISSRCSQLGAHETVTIEVVFAGASVYSTEKTADEKGLVTLELLTDDEDATGRLPHPHFARGRQSTKPSS